MVFKKFGNKSWLVERFIFIKDSMANIVDQDCCNLIILSDDKCIKYRLTF